MHGSRIFLLTSMVLTAAIRVSLAFNIDKTDPDVYTGEQKDFFGYKVVQFMSGTEKGIIVTAPLQRNGSGGICKPVHVNNTQCFNPEEISLDNATIPVKHLGLSIAEHSNSSRFTVCSPSVAHECNENSYLNSVCYTMTSDLQQISRSTPAFQKCTKKTVDLVFLFDGSGSMTEAEFEKNKDFIVDIMKSLNQTSVKFAAVQFSFDYNKVFDFNDYQAGRALESLKKERHMKSLTNTHKALRFVLDEIFESPRAGASPDATKVLVLITDGDPSDSDNGIIKRYNDKNIIRFVIGVKDVKLEKFKDIASEPKDKNIFKIENYNGLTGILENFQKKIFSMEGSKQALAGELTTEMSQSGFSAVFYKDTMILGSVGANMWRGSLLELHQQKETQILDPSMKNDSYMGYSTSVGEKNKAPLYFTGAPRFEHKGQVLLFQYNGKNWTTAQRINGEQIGSYFGAELCSVDIDSDGNTDFLLVGAPLFFQEKEKREGHIYVYTLTDKMLLDREQNISAPSMGRFGTTISSLADLNGDGLRDVAVAAPLEDDNRGAVYIFLGDKHRGIRSTFSQRILGKEIQPGLRFFGQSVYGEINLGEDGLPDIVVGSQGMAVVLRSRPVFNVTAHLSFQPHIISTEKIDCIGNTNENLPMVNLTACFEMVETTKSKAGAINISYTLRVDPTRQIIRGTFNQNDRKAKNVTSTAVLRDKDTCFNYSVYMPKCVIDTLSPISIKVNFAQNDRTGPVLNMDSKRQAVVEVPFEKQCRKNDTCIADLELTLQSLTPTLLVAKGNYFSLSVNLSNHGDDSYNTSLSIHHPVGLSFAQMTVAESTRPTLHSCKDVVDRVTCGISLPVYRSRSAATFTTSFHIDTGYEWNDTVSMTITGKSDNTNSSRTNSLTKSIPVQFLIEMVVTVNEDTITYLNFSTEDAAPKEMVAIYKIRNTGFKAYPINVSLVFPTKLDHNFQMENYQVLVQQNKTQCTGITDKKSDYCSPEKYCRRIVCDSFILDKYSSTEFNLTGDVQFKDLKQRAENIAFLKRYTGEGAAVKFKSFIDISYDDQRYVLHSTKQQNKGDLKQKSAETGLWSDPTKKWTEVQVEFIIPPDQLLIILTGVILGLLLLIIITVIMFKLGCFKRKTLEYYQEQEERASLQAGGDTDLTSDFTEGTASHSQANGKSDEEKDLLDLGQADGATQPGDTKEELD
ncbi:integrin alpha-L-like isoform X2 [Acanthopagrus latus]|uniref:integrin alpha-L-like isoform X2 n=1 Tax=Acanthopagrus latus TaxID=8177 RepID=UPI00187C61CB|nr:integrin alpha-L-like isoform X2 [Acanthopagrus latus]